MRRVVAGLRAARIRPNGGARIAAAVAGVLFLAACTPADGSTADPPAPEPSITATGTVTTAPPTTAAPVTTAAPTIRASSVAPAATARRTATRSVPKPSPKPEPSTAAPKPAPKPVTQPKPSPTAAAPANCDPAYPDVCLKDGIGDYDCSSGSGNGPNYVRGPIRVRPPDPFDLDRDGDGIGCENG